MRLPRASVRVAHSPWSCSPCAAGLLPGPEFAPRPSSGDALLITTSPSAVRIWAERAGTAAAAICIGETSAVEARGVGFERVIFPEKPGVESWADCVAEWFEATPVEG